LDEYGPPDAVALRCLFGNPSRPATLDPAWLTSTTIALANGIYADRAFDRLPILADALQDAGCENDDVLSHCRRSGPHVRGCWVVDLALNKGWVGQSNPPGTVHSFCEFYIARSLPIPTNTRLSHANPNRYHRVGLRGESEFPLPGLPCHDTSPGYP